jgi:hypothetical protein
MTDADVIFFENALVLLKESTEIMQIIILIRHRMLVDDLPFGLIWRE